MSLLPIGGGTLNVSGSGTATSVTAFVCNAKTKAHGEYTGFSFNSLATIGGVHYGCKAGMIHSIGGATDAGTAIDAVGMTGITDFASEKNAGMGVQRKRLESVILNIRSESRVAVRVKVDETTERLYIPPAGPSMADGLSPVRTKPGKGLMGRNWQLGFENVGGGDFDLAAMDAFPIFLSRRVTS
jgi:hypothetical protein